MNATTTTTIALAAAALFLSGCNQDKPGTASPNDAANAPAGDASGAAAGATDTAKKMKCFGVNECSGQSGCDVPDGRVAPGSKGHACGGQNECAGKGWILLTQDECDSKGGEPV